MTDTGTNTDKPAPGRVRASDVEREEYAKVVRTAMTEGRLNLEEGEERLGKVYSTTYRDELGPLIADLPPSTMFNTPEFLAEAKHRLRAHTGRVVSTAALLTGVWLLVAILAHPMFFWPVIPIAIMTIGLMRHRRWYRWQQRGWSPWSGRGWAAPPWQHSHQHHQGPPWQHSHRHHQGPPWQHTHQAHGAGRGPAWHAGPCGRAR